MEVISEVGNVVGAGKVGQLVQIGQVGDPAHGTLIGDLQVKFSISSEVGVLSLRRKQKKSENALLQIKLENMCCLIVLDDMQLNERLHLASYNTQARKDQYNAHNTCQCNARNTCAKIKRRYNWSTCIQTHVKGALGLSTLGALLSLRRRGSLRSPRLLDLGDLHLLVLLLLLLSKLSAAVEIFSVDVLLRVGEIATAKAPDIGGGRRGNESGDGDEPEDGIVGKEHR